MTKNSIYATTTWLDTFRHLSTKKENHVFNSSHHQKLVTASLLFAAFCYSIYDPTKEMTLSKIRIIVILKYAFTAFTLVWKHSLLLCSFKTLTYSIKCASKRCSSNGRCPPSTVGYGQLQETALTNPAISWNTTKAKDKCISHLENRRNSIKMQSTLHETFMPNLPCKGEVFSRPLIQTRYNTSDSATGIRIQSRPQQI